MKWFSSAFVKLSIGTLLLVLSLGGAMMLHSKMGTPPVQKMSSLTAAVSAPFFIEMLAYEVPHLQNEESSSFLASYNTMDQLIHFSTAIHPHDPKSLLAAALPGLNEHAAAMIKSDETIDSVLESNIPELGLPQPAFEQETITKPSPAPYQSDAKKVLIYHSHNRESWLPELKDKGISKMNEAFDPEMNITLLGKRLAQQLEEHGIGAISSETDYPAEIEGYNWNFSYKYSLKTVQEVFAVHSELEYFFDLHRDAQKRDLTTVNINQTDYAKVYFIIGQKNKDWQKNEALANKLHNILERDFPGLSRGIWNKTPSSGHAEYNQSFSENSILVEIGGPENTLEESNRTIDILANAIAEIFWDARMVVAAK